MTQQYARPDSDISDGRWLNSAGNNTNLYSYIDEASVNDSDNIHVEDDWGSTDICIFGLGDVTDPSSAEDHKFTVRSIENGGAGSIDLTITLLQGASTTIRAVTINPGFEYGNSTTTLTESEANNITDYSDLRLKIQAVDQGGMGVTTSVSWAYFECPEAGGATQTGKAFLMFLDI